jgi:hypothetical protein
LYRASLTCKPTEDGQPAIYAGLTGRACDSNCRQNLRQIIRDDSVTGPLRVETDANQNIQSLSAPFSPEEASVRDTCDSSSFRLKRRSHLVEFVHNQLVIFVPVGMIFGQDVESLIVFAFRHQPTRRLRTKGQEERDLDCARKSLDEHR